MKKMIIAAVVLIVIFLIALNSGLVADQAVAWVKDHPKDPGAPDVLYRTARWCDLLGDTNKATEVYWQLYQQYPERGELCAPALYYCARIKVNDGAYIPAIKKQALPYLDIINNQYSGQQEWRTKAKQLEDEVNYVH